MTVNERAVLLAGKALWRRFDRVTHDPQKRQEEFLLDLIRRNECTGFGRDHRFDLIRNVDEYRRRVPVGDYERHRPYVERIKTGDLHALTADAPFMFTTTSGTTGEPKLIPVTRASRRINTALTRMWYYRALVDHPTFLRGKLLGVVSPAVEGRTPGGVPFGSASGQTYRTSPWWVRRAYAVPYEVCEIEDYDSRYYVLMRLAVEHRVSFFATANPSTIVKLAETADSCKEEIIRHIHSGSIAGRLELSNATRAKIASRLLPNPARAKELERLAVQHETLRPTDYWSELQLIGCWQGGTAGVHLKKFDRWFAPHTPIRDLGYLSSEAHVSLPIRDMRPEGILGVQSNFYEFIPEAEINAANPRTLLCHELQEGVSYYVLLTTSSGLYRYDINDVVKVAGFYNKTPVIEFLRKGRDVTSLTGEKVHVNQIMGAMEEARRAAGVALLYYKAIADEERARYGFMIELDGALPDNALLALFLDVLDRRLGELNIEYAQKRKSKRLGPPYLHIKPPGWFNKHRLSGDGAVRDSQFKASLLSYKREEDDAALLRIEP